MSNSDIDALPFWIALRIEQVKVFDLPRILSYSQPIKRNLKRHRASIRSNWPPSEQAITGAPVTPMPKPGIQLTDPLAVSVIQLRAVLKIGADLPGRELPLKKYDFIVQSITG